MCSEYSLSFLSKSSRVWYSELWAPDISVFCSLESSCFCSSSKSWGKKASDLLNRKPGMISKFGSEFICQLWLMAKEAEQRMLRKFCLLQQVKKTEGVYIWQLWTTTLNTNTFPLVCDYDQDSSSPLNSSFSKHCSMSFHTNIPVNLSTNCYFNARAPS